MASRLQKVFEAKLADSFSAADAAANHSEESDFGDSDSDDERGRKLQQIQKKVCEVSHPWFHWFVQLREVQEQLAYLMDLQARLVKAGKRKKKKGDMGAGKKGGNRDGEGLDHICSRRGLNWILVRFTILTLMTITKKWPTTRSDNWAWISTEYAQATRQPSYH